MGPSSAAIHSPMHLSHLSPTITKYNLLKFILKRFGHAKGPHPSISIPAMPNGFASNQHNAWPDW